MCVEVECNAWIPERTETVPEDPRYFGRPEKTVTYPARCALCKGTGRIWPVVEIKKA